MMRYMIANSDECLLSALAKMTTPSRSEGKKHTLVEMPGIPPLWEMSYDCDQ